MLDLPVPGQVGEQSCSPLPFARLLAARRGPGAGPGPLDFSGLGSSRLRTSASYTQFVIAFLRARMDGDRHTVQRVLACSTRFQTDFTSAKAAWLAQKTLHIL